MLECRLVTGTFLTFTFNLILYQLVLINAHITFSYSGEDQPCRSGLDRTGEERFDKNGENGK